MKKVNLILSAVVIAVIMLNSCGYFASKEEGASKEVTIGSQVWMTKNLDVLTFRNGDRIPEAKTDEEWKKAGENKQPAWCYYDNDPENGAKYGKLYNWYAVNDSRGLAHEGWKIPSDEDWSRLTDFLGGEDVAGTKMKSTNGWANNFKGESGNGTNESGFSGLPGSYRHPSGTFEGIGLSCTWWSSSELGPSVAWTRSLNYKSGSVDRDDIYWKEYGYYVRCLRD